MSTFVKSDQAWSLKCNKRQLTRWQLYSFRPAEQRFRDIRMAILLIKFSVASRASRNLARSNATTQNFSVYRWRSDKAARYRFLDSSSEMI